MNGHYVTALMLTAATVGALHSLGHGHGHHDHGKTLSEWGLFVLFCCDPCIALIPMIVAASTATATSSPALPSSASARW